MQRRGSAINFCYAGRRVYPATRRMNVQSRLQSRCNMSEAVEARETASEPDIEGVTHSDPKAAKQAATDYFDDVFAGTGVKTWFEGEGVGAGGVKLFFEDSAPGREAREAGLRGRWPRDWEDLPQWQQRLRQMVRHSGDEAVILSVPPIMYYPGPMALSNCGVY